MQLTREQNEKRATTSIHTHAQNGRYGPVKTSHVVGTLLIFNQYSEHRTDGWMLGWLDGWTDGRTKRMNCSRMDEQRIETTSDNDNKYGRNYEI